MEIDKIKSYIKTFCENRDWQTFHSPKNLAMALSVEAAELLEIFQWLTEEQSKNIKNDNKLFESVKDEMGDILFCLVRLSDVLGINLIEAFWDKTKKIEQKHTLEKGKELTDKVQKACR